METLPYVCNYDSNCQQHSRLFLFSYLMYRNVWWILKLRNICVLFFSSVSPSENSENISNPSRSERLILEDLVQPGHSELSNYSPFKKICKMAGSSTDFQKKPRDKVIVFKPVYLKVALLLDMFNIFFLEFFLMPYLCFL